MEATYRATSLVWQTWQHAAAENAAKTRQLEHNARAFVAQYRERRCYLFLEAWRNYTARRIGMKVHSWTSMLKWKKRVFAEMKRASEGSRLLRKHAAIRAEETLTRTFRWWRINCRRRRRNDAVAQLIMAGRKRSFVHESFLAWAEVTARWLAAKALQRRSLQASHWMQWKAFVNSRMRRREQAEDLVARSRTSCLRRYFRSWRVGAQERMDTKLQAFTAWQKLTSYCRGLAKAKQIIEGFQGRSIRISVFSAWERKARLTRRSRTLAITALCMRAIEAFRLFTRKTMKIKHARESLCAQKYFETLSSVFGAWRKLQWRLKELRQLHVQATGTLRQCRIQPWWVVWRRKTATAISLRRWVAQAVGNPVQTDRVPLLPNSRHPATVAAPATGRALRSADGRLGRHSPQKPTQICSCRGKKGQAVATGLASLGCPSCKNVTFRLGLLQNPMPSTTKDHPLPNACNWTPHDVLTDNDQMLSVGTSGLTLREDIASEGKTCNHSMSSVELHAGSPQSIRTDNAKQATTRYIFPRHVSASEVPCSSGCNAADGNACVPLQNGEKWKKKPLDHKRSHSSRGVAQWRKLAHRKKSEKTNMQGRSRVLLRRKLKMLADSLLLVYWKRKLQQVIRMWVLLAYQKREQHRDPCDHILSVSRKPVVGFLTAANNTSVSRSAGGSK